MSEQDTEPTPGPWVARESENGRVFVVSRTESPPPLADVGKERRSTNALADAELMAAAPEMQDALEDLTEAVQKALGDPENVSSEAYEYLRPAWSEAVDALEAAGVEVRES